MAKLLMKDAETVHAAEPDYLSPALRTMLFNIVNSQNYQIHQMEGLLSDMGSERGTALCDQESLDSSPGRRSSGEGRAIPGRSGATQERAAAPQQANSRQFFVKHAMFSDADAGSLLIFDGSEGFAGAQVQSGDLTEAPVLQVRAPCNPWKAHPTQQTRVAISRPFFIQHSPRLRSR